MANYDTPYVTALLSTLIIIIAVAYTAHAMRPTDHFQALDDDDASMCHQSPEGISQTDARPECTHDYTGNNRYLQTLHSVGDITAGEDVGVKMASGDTTTLDETNQLSTDMNEDIVDETGYLTNLSTEHDDNVIKRGLEATYALGAVTFADPPTTRAWTDDGATSWYDSTPGGVRCADFCRNAGGRWDPVRNSACLDARDSAGGAKTCTDRGEILVDAEGDATGERAALDCKCRYPFTASAFDTDNVGTVA